MALPTRPEQREYEKFDPTTGGVKVGLVEYRLGANHNGEQTGVVYTYSASTNRIQLAAAVKHVVIHTSADVYMVLDSSDPATDLENSAVRIYIPADYTWERSLSSAVQTFDFRSVVNGVTAEVRVEGYEGA